MQSIDRLPGLRCVKVILNCMQETVQCIKVILNNSKVILNNSEGDPRQHLQESYDAVLSIEVDIVKPIKVLKRSAQHYHNA